MWAVSDTLAPADAVVVLGGSAAGTNYRPYAAAELYRRGLAGRILLDDDGDRRLVQTLDIPPQAVEMFGNGLHNTHEEACTLADWAEKNAARRFIIPTELFPSRRVSWVFARELRNLGGNVMIDIVSIPESTADNWWSRKQGRDQFQTELAKYFYYRVRYFFDRC